MSWSKVKTMLIVLFVFVNAFLLYNTFKIGSSSEISQQTINETVQILRKNNVTVDSSVIRQKAETIKKAEISNSIDARSNLAANLLGNCSETEDGYVSGNGRLKFSSVAFYYENYDKSAKNDINDNNAVEVAASFLNEKKFEVKSSSVRDFTSHNEGYEVKFGKDINGYSVFESYIQINISRDGVLESIEGYWPEVIVGEGYSMEVDCVSEATVLINLLSAEGFDSSVENEVVDIHTGYTLGGPPESDSPILLTLLPAYRVILKNGENYIFDAENGEFIYKY